MVSLIDIKAFALGLEEKLEPLLKNKSLDYHYMERSFGQLSGADSVSYAMACLRDILRQLQGVISSIEHDPDSDHKGILPRLKTLLVSLQEFIGG